jgi:hypothetical protein
MPPPTSASAPATGPSAEARSGSAAVPAADRKVLVIVEENKTYDEIIGSRSAPYLNQLADRYGLATSMDAGYPARCPSLAAYILLTSGSDHGICDDDPPAAHPLTGDSIYRQLDMAGRPWRGYAESMPRPCALDNSDSYLVRHAPAAYYVDERTNCARWDLPSGSPQAGALHDDLARGALPAYAILTPNACNDMHGSLWCPGNLIRRGDNWLAAWMPQILASPDYTSGRLTVFITWDEGSDTDNHIATLAISPRTSGVRVATPWTTCSLLRTSEELLGLSPLGCAAATTSMTGAFHLVDAP